MLTMTVLDLDERTIGDTIGYLLGTRAGAPREYAAGRVIADVGRRECCSYGRHFPLFRYVPRTYRLSVDGEWLDMRRPSPLFVLNGDRWNGGGWNRSRTTDHQEIARRLVEATGISSIVLPFSALDGAGIDIDSIVPLEVTSDTWYDETVTVERLEDMPKWRQTRTVRAAGPLPQWGFDPNLSVTLPVVPDPDGRYSWTENRHRLGESLFTASRTIVEPSRPAEPFETNRHTNRETVRLATFQDSRWWYLCEPNSHGPHETGPSGACIHCGEPLFARTWWRKRARYLSAFDYQETAPLYFLCEVPRTGHPTVDGALDSLAPRAVHAARLNNRDVRRQGDVFFVATDQTRESLEQRGALFARLTQWTRDAKPRTGEIGFTAPNREREKRIARLETAYARKQWRLEWNALQARAAAAVIPDPQRRETNRAAWTETLARHTREQTAADNAGVAYNSDVSLPCANPHCGAAVGEPCREFVADSGRRYPCDGSRGLERRLSYQHSRQLDELRREAGKHRTPVAAPHSPRGTRRKWAKHRADRLRAIETANRQLRRAILTGRPPDRYPIGGGRRYRETVTDYRRRTHAHAVRIARENLERATMPVDSNGNHHSRQTRDSYRQRYGSNAVALWDRCLADAQRRYRPETVADTDRRRRYRETLRRHLMVYGTAHSATEVARVNGTVYVRGTVRHVIELEPNRRGGPDHRPLPLADGIWYLAVRNTVPRQTVSRRRRNGRRTISG